MPDNITRARNKATFGDGLTLNNIVRRLVQNLCRLRKKKSFPLLDHSLITETVRMKFRLTQAKVSDHQMVAVDVLVVTEFRNL